MSMVDTFDVTGLLLERVLQAIEALTQTVASTPPPTMPPVDLGEIVTAVNGLRPGVTAEEIAAAIGRVIQPQVVPDTSPQLEKMAGLLEQVEYRLRAPGQVVGGGVMNLPSNLITNNTLKVTSVGAATSPPELAQIRDGLSGYETQLDYDVRTDGLPVYIGKNVQGTATSATTWQIQKLTYDGSNRLTRAEVLTGAWTNRAALGW